MTDTRGLGLYRKYDVARTDGTDQPGGKHHGCRLFVLDLDHDPHARAAARRYASSCEDDYPALARDLGNLLDVVEADPGRSVPMPQSDGLPPAPLTSDTLADRPLEVLDLGEDSDAWAIRGSHVDRARAVGLVVEHVIRLVGPSGFADLMDYVGFAALDVTHRRGAWSTEDEDGVFVDDAAGELWTFVR